MVSEDSDQLGSGLLMVHGCDDLDEIGKAGPRKVSAMLHLFDAIGELVEVRSLSRSQWILPEEGDNHPAQVRALSYHEPMKRLVVIVIPRIGIDGANSEVRLQRLEALQALCSLSNREFVRQLIAGSVADAIRPMRLSHQAD